GAVDLADHFRMVRANGRFEVCDHVVGALAAGDVATLAVGDLRHFRSPPIWRGHCGSALWRVRCTKVAADEGDANPALRDAGRRVRGPPPRARAPGQAGTVALRLPRGQSGAAGRAPRTARGPLA